MGAGHVAGLHGGLHVVALVHTLGAGHVAGLHAGAQTPPEHMDPAGQALPQPPQLFGSMVTSVQKPPQSAFGGRQPAGEQV